MDFESGPLINFSPFVTQNLEISLGYSMFQHVNYDSFQATMNHLPPFASVSDISEVAGGPTSDTIYNYSSSLDRYHTERMNPNWPHIVMEAQRIPEHFPWFSQGTANAQFHNTEFEHSLSCKRSPPKNTEGYTDSSEEQKGFGI